MFSRVVRSTAAPLRRAAAARGLATVATRRTNYANIAAGLGVGAGAVAFVLSDAAKAEGNWFTSMLGGGSSGAPAGEWIAVAEEIKAILDDEPNHGPFFMRLAWHCAGSYSKEDGTGGSNGATMRFAPESAHGGNAGLGEARDLLEAVKAKHPTLTYADIYTFSGKVSAETMGCPTVAWKPGRVDFAEGEGVTPDGRLPDGDLGATHLRDVFYRMGFDDKQIVSLSGAHALGFCHDDRSGFSGPWTDTPTEFSNKYFRYMLDKKWQLKKWEGPPQFEDVETQTMMMLMTDMCLTTDKSFRKYVDVYAADNDTFLKDFAKDFGQLLELGVPRS